MSKCHILFDTKEGYRKQVLDLLKSYESELIQLYYHLEELGHNHDVIGIEMNAYIVTEKEYLASKGIKVPKRLTEILSLLFEQVSENL